MDESIGPNTQNQGSFVTPLLISLAGLVGSTLAIVAYHLILFKFCIGRRSRSRSGFIDSAIQADSPIGNGVEKHVLDAIPIFIFSKCQLSECVICLGELEEGDMARLLPICGHVFHVECIDDWFIAHTNCPICRSPIEQQTNCEETIQKITSSTDQDLADDQFLEQQQQEGGEEASTSGSTRHMPRHSVSFVLPMEGNKSKDGLELKRSLSMDHSFVAIDMQREISDQKNGDATCSNSSSLKGDFMEDRSYGTLSMKQLDRMSLMLVRSFSQMRIGRGVTNGVVLPR